MPALGLGLSLWPIRRRPPVSQGYVGVLNLMSVAPAAAFSLRRLTGAYTGPAVRVRRSSDNTEQDIGFTAGGGLNTAALLAFVGGGSGFVSLWYDQSGNNRHVANPVASSQPRIATNGNTNEWLDFFSTTSGNSGALAFDVDLVTGWPRTTSTVWQNLANTGGIVLGDAAAGSQYLRITGSSPSSQQFTPGNSYGTAFSAAAPGAVLTQVSLGGGAGQISGWAGGVSVGSAAGPAGQGGHTSGLGCWGSRTSSGGNSGWQTKEMIIFGAALSTADRQTLERNQGTYYGITVA